VFGEEQVVRLGPVDAADLVHVAESARGEQSGGRAVALEDGVDRDRRSVQEEPAALERGLRLFDTVDDALDQTVRRRECLAESRLAGTLVETDDIGESAADVGGNAHRQPGCGGVRFHAVILRRHLLKKKAQY